MKQAICILFLLLAFAGAVSAQTDADALAIAGGRTFTVQDLDPSVAELWTGLSNRISEARTTLLDQQIERTVLEMEAAKRGVSVQELVDAEVTAKVKDPSDEEVLKVYEDNKADIGPVPIEEVKPQIVRFLRQNLEKQAYAKYAETVMAGYKIAKEKDINAKDLKPSDPVATIDATHIFYVEYQKRNGLILYELEANITDEVIEAVTQVVDAAVYTSEAQSLGITASELLAKEVTNKLNDYSDLELKRLTDHLRDRLYRKYRVTFFVKEVTPYVQKVSADDDPFTGKAAAPVTVIMFTDYQCPGCAGVHPVLEKVVKEFGDKVRFVIRDFPLTSIHDHAFAAAVAANAALRQGKFYEYAELLYNNQDSLDDASLRRYAGEAGLNISKFEKDIRDPEISAEIRKDMDDGRSYGLTGTPGVFVNGYKVRSLSEPSFRKAIARAVGKP